MQEIYILVIAQPECNMPYIALEQYNALGPHEGACNN